MTSFGSTVLLLVVCASLVGCLSSDRRPSDPRRDDVASAETMPRYFQDCVTAGEYHKAYALLSAESRRLVSFEEFYLALSHFSAARRLISGWEIDDARVEGDRGLLVIAHREFGLRLEVPVRRLTIREPREMTLWSFDFSRKEYDEYLALARRWIACQSRDLGGRLYAVPPWWRYRPLFGDAPRYEIDSGQ